MHTELTILGKKFDPIGQILAFMGRVSEVSILDQTPLVVVDWQERFLDLERSLEQKLEQAKDETAFLRTRIVLMERQLETGVCDV